MQISNRVQVLTGGGSDGWDVFYRGRALAEAGEPVVELTIGEHDIRTDASILSAMDASARGGHTGYASVPGVSELRKAVAKRVAARTGVATGVDNVLVTPGGQAALFAAHMAAVEPGDTALFLDPYYVTYPGTLRAAGAVPKPVQTRPEDGFQPNRAALEAALPGARSLLINSPNNPSGAVYSRSAMEEVAGVCKDHDLCLISDEVYDTQVWEGEHISPRSLDGMVERTLVVGSMSKSHAMTGSRIGWLVGPEAAIEGLSNLATHTTYGVPGFIQDAAVFALQTGDALEEDVGAPFRRRRDIALNLLEGQNIIRVSKPSGAMYVMLDIRATGLSGSDFAERLLDEERIAVMPGESFGAAAAGHIRVAMTVADDKFADALSRLITFAGRLS